MMKATIHPPLGAAAWPIVRGWAALDDLCIGVFDCPHTTPELTHDGPFVVRSQDVRSGVFRMDEAGRVSEATYGERIARAEPTYGDILYSREGTYFGNAAEVPPGVRVCLGQRMVLIKPRRELANSRFLRFWLNSPILKEHILGFRDGTVAERLNMPTIRNIPVPLVPIEEQERVGEILGALDDKIELNRRMNDTLEAMAQAIFHDWFVDFGPVRRKLAGATNPVEIMGGLVPSPERAAELSTLFPTTLNGDELPSGFEFVTLGEAVAVLETGTRPKGGIKGISAGVPSIGAESIVGLAKFDFSKTRYVPTDFFSSMRRGVIGDRDVLLYKDGGRPGQFEPHVAMFGAGFPFLQCCINEHVYRLVAADPFSQDFLYFHLNSEGSMGEMRNKGTGVAIPGLNSTAANSLSILNPGAKLLAAFTNSVRPLVDAALLNASESRTLSETRDYLLPRLMSGEVIARAAMDMVEDAA